MQAGNQEERTPSILGLSLYDFMEAFEKGMEPELMGHVNLAGCEMFELTTNRMYKGAEYAPEEEVVQHLAIRKDGVVRFTSNTYHKGEGKLGIGRVVDAKISAGTMKEICDLVDSWLFSTGSQAFNLDEPKGRWILRARFEDGGSYESGGREDLQQGTLAPAFFAGIDICQFIRERIPVSGMYLFEDQI